MLGLCDGVASFTDGQGYVIVGTDPDTDARSCLYSRPDEKEPFVALAFQDRYRSFRRSSCVSSVLIPAYLESGSYVYNTRSEQKERISRVFQMHANKQNQIERLQAR